MIFFLYTILEWNMLLPSCGSPWLEHVPPQDGTDERHRPERVSSISRFSYISPHSCWRRESALAFSVALTWRRLLPPWKPDEDWQVVRQSLWRWPVPHFVTLPIFVQFRLWSEQLKFRVQAGKGVKGFHPPTDPTSLPKTTQILKKWGVEVSLGDHRFYWSFWDASSHL